MQGDETICVFKTTNTIATTINEVVAVVFLFISKIDSYHSPLF